MKDINKKLFPVYIIVGLILLVGGSYALFSETLIGEKKYNLASGDLRLYLDESQTSKSILLTNVIPVSDEDGMLNDSYLFSLANEGEEELNYTIHLKEEKYNNQTPASAIRYYYSRDVGNVSEIKNLDDSVDNSGNYYLEKGVIPANTTYNYELKMWIDYNAGNEVAGTQCSFYLEIYAEQVVEYVDNSGANPPELTSGMIPVTYNETSKTWVKADTSEKWYDYETQMWANAVTVTEDTRDTYMSADAGAPISMDDINTMWVWIPRYEYNYSNLGPFVATDTATGEGFGGEIGINFISSDVTTPSNSGLYRIPEGFKFGDENISGFWMGKFETSILESCTPARTSVDTGCDLTTLTPQIKPDVTSWRGARVSTFFETSRLMQSSDNASIYGFDVDGTSSMDTHMLKNTEWGIVAYLSQSRYGKYGNSNYTGVNKEVYQNKSVDYMTGMSSGVPGGVDSDTLVNYNTPDTGYGASTTGTIYGVYDMSGGATEYVMGNLNNISGYSSTENSGFCGTNGPSENCREWPEFKYYDLYTETPKETGYKFGDATWETEWFYGDAPHFVHSAVPWFERGGSTFSNLAYAGVFYMSTTGENGSSMTSFGTHFAIKP